jgi:hypothetical protein
MKRLLLILAAAAAVLAAPGPAAAGVCGLPDTKPVWIDFGALDLQSVFARPGVNVAVTGEGGYPAAMRAAGAHTVFWDMYLNRRVGTPSAPADPSVLPARAQRLFEFAVRASGCQTPVIAMNELFGAQLPTPWTATNAKYRQNVLAWARLLAAKGAKPALLLSNDPYTDGEAAQWWRDVAQVSDFVLEKYFSAAAVSKAGPVLGNRRMRTSMRRSAAKLFAVGIPASKVGIILAFQTRKGAGGREGLQPSSNWFEVAKWQALAARQVARELGLAHLWSWGWGTYNSDGADPDKPRAACAWLWTRDPALCDAPATLGDEFDDDLAAGQIDLPAGVRCAYGNAVVTTNQIGELARVTGDPELALSALYGRLVESRAAPVAGDEVLAAERSVVRERFRGSRGAYLAALGRARATLAVSRGVIADGLRRAALQAGRRAPAPTPAEVERFYTTYAPVLAREVEISPAPSWLPGGRGVVLATIAPARLFVVPNGRTSTVWSPEGPLQVKPLGDAEPLGAWPLEAARPAISRALRATERVNAYHDWTVRRQRAALAQLRCTRDRLPAIAAVELTSFLPYLELTAGE